MATMWAIQFRSMDESESVWRNLILFKSEEEAVRVCRLINIKAHKFDTFRVHKITSANTN